MEKITEIKIKGKKYQVKKTLRAVLDYEKDLNKNTIDSLGDQIKMFFYLLKNANRKKTDDYDKFTIGYEAFLDALDEDESLYNAYSGGQEIVTEEQPKKK